MELKPIADQVIVIMGASSGIGRETAIELAQQGARVVLSARGEDGLDSLAEAILGFGGEAHVVPADVTDPEQVRTVARKAVERYGRIDTWVHLAAVSIYARLEDTRPEEFEQVVRTDLLGQAYGAMAALPHLRRTGRGAFVSVSSVEALRALPFQSAYAAAKQGVHGMLEALRVELRHDRIPISVTEIMPSSVDTPLFEHARTRLGVRPRGMAPVYDARLVAAAIAHAAQHPTRRLIVGGGGRALATLEALAPGLTDRFLAMTGFAGQRTGIRKSAQAGDNLTKPIDQGHSVSGDQILRGRSWSLYTAWALSPLARPSTVAAGIAGGLLLGAVMRRSRRHQGAQREERLPRLEPRQHETVA